MSVVLYTRVSMAECGRGEGEEDMVQMAMVKQEDWLVRSP